MTLPPQHMSLEQFEDPASWTADDLLDVLCEDDGIDMANVSDEAIRGAIPVAQTRGLAIPLGALEHENGRRSVLRGEVTPTGPIPVLRNDPARARAGDVDALARIQEAIDAADAAFLYADTIMLPAEISLQQAVEIEAFLQGKGEATLNAAEGSISFEMYCADLWDACEAAHEVVAELQSHGVEAAVDRDLLTRGTGQPSQADA